MKTESSISIPPLVTNTCLLLDDYVRYTNVLETSGDVQPRLSTTDDKNIGITISKLLLPFTLV